MIYVKDREPYIIFKGKPFYPYDGLYIGTSERFFRGGLRCVSRCIKANSHDAAVVVLEDE